MQGIYRPNQLEFAGIIAISNPTDNRLFDLFYKHPVINPARILTPDTMKTMSLAKLKEGGQEGELVESKHMIKEALLSNPTLLSNIIVNLQQKNSELPQTVQENMEIFQETDESPGKIGPEGQQSLPEPREEKAAQQDFQFEEVEQSVNQQSAYNKKKVNKPSKTVQRAIRSKKSRQNVSNPKQQGRDKKKAGKERPINNKNKLDQDEQQSQKQSQSPKPAANKAFAKKIARTKRSSASTQKQTRTASSQQKASGIDQQAVQEEAQQRQIKKPKKPMPKQKEQPPMRQLQFIVEIKQDRELKKMLPKQKLNKVGRAANQTKQHQIIDFAIKIQLLSKKEYQDFQQKQAKTKRKGKQQQKGQRQRFGGIANEREEEVNHFINQQKKINLGSLSLLEIVQVLKDQGFLDESIYDKFAANHTSYDINDFLKKFSSGQLATFDYKLIPFTLLDHRRLSELVSNLRQESYFIGEILSLNKQVHNFLVSLYDLQAEKYYKLYKNIDEISKIEWWSELIEANKAAVMETCKRNLQNRKNVDVKEHIATPKSGAGVKGKPYKRRRA